MGPPAGEALIEPAIAPRARPPAVLWRRAAARAIDAATVFFVLWALVVLRVLWFMGELSERVDLEPWGRRFVATVTFVVFHAVYEVVFLTRNQGQTPGKDIMNIRVVPLDGGDDVTAVRAATRWLVPGVGVLVPPVWLGAMVVCASGVTAAAGRRRAVHDLVAGTMVVPYARDREDPSSAVGPVRPRRVLWRGAGTLGHRESRR
ncbi:MAG: RDD family protein [Acidimicrobiales bacterium]